MRIKTARGARRQHFREFYHCPNDCTIVMAPWLQRIALRPVALYARNFIGPVVSRLARNVITKQILDSLPIVRGHFRARTLHTAGQIMVTHLSPRVSKTRSFSPLPYAVGSAPFYRPCWLLNIIFVFGRKMRMRIVRQDKYLNKKLITRWDSEHEHFYDDIVHVDLLQNTKLTVFNESTYAEVYKDFIVVKSDLQLKWKIIMSK